MLKPPPGAVLPWNRTGGHQFLRGKGDVVDRGLRKERRCAVDDPPFQIEFTEAEHVLQTLAGIFLVELQAVVRGARVPAVTAQSIVLAGHAQFIHRTIHRIE